MQTALITGLSWVNIIGATSLSKNRGKANCANRLFLLISNPSSNELNESARKWSVIGQNQH